MNNLNDWVHQIARAWDDLNLARKMQMARFAGLDYQQAYDVAQCRFRDLEEGERAKIIATFSNLVAWVWEAFERPAPPPAPPEPEKEGGEDGSQDVNAGAETVA